MSNIQRAIAAVLLAIAGCGNATPATPATVFNADGKPVRATVIFKTGDGIPVPGPVEFPSGTRVTFLGEGSSKEVARIRVEEGEHKGRDATVPRDALRMER